MIRTIFYFAILFVLGCADSKPPTPNTDPDAVKKLEREVEQIQKGGAGEGKGPRE